MFETEIAADMGSAVTRLATRKTISSNETRAALDPKNASRVLAVGDASRKLLGATEAYPVRGGIADITLAALMLRRFALELLGRRSLVGVTLKLAFPFAQKPIDRAAAVEVGREAGFRRVILTDSLLAAADGAGVDILSPKANMLVDIGRNSINTAVFANGGVISETASHMGSALADRAIMSYFAEEQRMLIGSAAAERIKKSLGSALIRVSGRDPSSGMPSVRELRPSALREAIKPCIDMLCSEVACAIAALPPDAAADLIENGITLTGGGALQFGLGERFEDLLGVPVTVAQNAENAAILGMQQSLMRGSAVDIDALSKQLG